MEKGNKKCASFSSHAFFTHWNLNELNFDFALIVVLAYLLKNKTICSWIFSIIYLDRKILQNIFIEFTFNRLLFFSHSIPRKCESFCLPTKRIVYCTFHEFRWITNVHPAGVKAANFSLMRPGDWSRRDIRE